MELSHLCQKLIGTLEKYPEIELAFLYGSAATGRLTDNSDIDIAIGTQQLLSFDTLVEIANRLTLLINREVSVIPFYKMQGVILKEVLTKGVPLLSLNKNMLSNLIIQMMEFSEDIEPFHRMAIDKKIKDFLNEPNGY